MSNSCGLNRKFILQAEIYEKVGKTKRPPLEDRGALPYTEATLCEILRLATTSPLTAPHETTCDTELFGYKISKGTEAGLAYILHIIYLLLIVFKH